MQNRFHFQVSSTVYLSCHRQAEPRHFFMVISPKEYSYWNSDHYFLVLFTILKEKGSNRKLGQHDRILHENNPNAIPDKQITLHNITEEREGQLQKDKKSNLSDLDPGTVVHRCLRRRPPPRSPSSCRDILIRFFLTCLRNETDLFFFLTASDLLLKVLFLP